MTYLLLKTAHLLMAMAFIGTLFFQVMILWPALQGLQTDGRQQLSQRLSQRARQVIHWVALVLYGTGIALAWPYRHLLESPLASTFALLLSLKLLLAVLIIVHYLALILLRRRQSIAERGMYRLNVSLLLHAMLLVFCAKAMFML
ncbi:hypothetical protein [Halopseudomonas salegens]|uniref:Integral membrane protein n=1 Tax=Halopseudomonas salegens TaxID=1434072 RepID=A0A1H2F6X2_9GAMM|nr:hypothetical protein [Halopseudomonas salegens]SDU03136.1 hypothetical protein SAMN05216210_1336 [Halopseudomonas salegens]